MNFKYECYMLIIMIFLKACYSINVSLINLFNLPLEALINIQVFKTKFIGWDDVIGVDFTRTAQSVQRTGADLNKWAKQQE